MSPITKNNYGQVYQEAQIKKHTNRHRNHWKARVELLQDLIKNHSLPRLKNKQPKQIVTVDVGCSIGTMAIELSKNGYNSFGLDFDNEALKIASRLNKEENTSVTFLNVDINEWKQNLPPIDIAVCFDIFEHLHDDELGSLLQSIKNQLSPQGSLIFHTFPTEYDHLFYEKFYVRLPLILFQFLPVKVFERLVKAYASLIDAFLSLAIGYTYKERIKFIEHCNPTSKARLGEILRRAGFVPLLMEASNLYPFHKNVQLQFSRHKTSYRNLYGVAVVNK